MLMLFKHQQTASCIYQMLPNCVTLCYFSSNCVTVNNSVVDAVSYIITMGFDITDISCSSVLINQLLKNIFIQSYINTIYTLD